MRVITNDLRKLPHHEGQSVLRIRDDANQWEIEARYHGGSYGVYLYAVKNDKPSWTRATRRALTPQNAREVAADLAEEFFHEREVTDG